MKGSMLNLFKKNSFLEKIRRVKIKDLLQLWKLPISICISMAYKHFRDDLWIVCEDAMEARDNGYWFFKYVVENHPEQDCIYAINKKSPDYQKVARIGATVEFGSLKHWILYFVSTKKISSQKAGNPNAAIFHLLEVYGFIKDNRIFLQHGITQNDVTWLYYKNTKFERFICGSAIEYRYIEKRFGYPSDKLMYTGFCRFDNLHNDVGKEYVLIMPTWRDWIGRDDKRISEIEESSRFEDTQYYKAWNDLLNDTRLKEISEKYNVKFVFYPHRNMQKFLHYFNASDDYLTIADVGHYDVQSLLKHASLLITDYSSVAFDCFYMKKPVIYYQFDYDTFRTYQYAEGYFNYQDNAFAKSVRGKDELIDLIVDNIKNNYLVSSEYLDYHKEFFEKYDGNNCARVYEVVKGV